jgi:hypothetical protein
MNTLRLRDERGMALILAVLILFLLSVTLVSVMTFTSESARHASRSKAGQQAYAAAEAGYNDALAQLAQLYSTGPTTAYLAAWGNPSGSAAYTGGNATWSSSWTPSPLPTGGSNPYRGTWSITATGSTSNPAVPGASLTRRITAAIDVSELPGTRTAPDLWSYIYTGYTAATCDFTIDNTVTLTAPLYMPGDLCLNNQGKILQPSTFVAVGGNVTISSQQGSIGTTSARIPEVHVGGTCQFWTKSPRTPCQFNNNNVQVWATDGYTYMPNPEITPPSVDWTAMYLRAAPGPESACLVSSGTPPTFESAGSSTPDKSVPGVFNLTPNQSYTCRADNGGELSWNASTRVLTVKGNIFIDGSVTVDPGSNVATRYSGTANLYVTGSVSFKNATLCARVSGSSCDWNGWAPGVTDDILIIASNGNGDGGVGAGNSIEVSSSGFQGGLFATNTVNIKTTSQVQGPIVTPGQIILGQTAVTTFPKVFKIEAGAPGDPSPPIFAMGVPHDLSS